MWYTVLLVSLGVGFIPYVYKAINICFGYLKYKYDNKFEALKINRHTLAVPYKYQHRQYYALLPIKRHKSDTVVNVYTTVLDLDEELILKDMDYNVTRDIHMYMGHNGDFSGANITPKDLGFSNLRFNVMTGTGELKTFNFKENNIINFD